MAEEFGPASETAALERALASSAALRRLALRLAPDAAAADDLLQEAWLAALRAPAAPDGGWLPWLRGVLRLRARESRRRDARRDRRERDAARPEARPDASEALARLELHEVLLRELRALPEPYRRALIERWLEERSVAEIAARTGAPVGTVETRLKRGLVLLRVRLERAGRGGAAAWLSDLSLLVLAPHVGWLLMRNKQRALLASLAAVVITGVAVLAVQQSAAPEARRASSLDPAEPTLVRDESVVAASADEPPSARAAATSEPARAAVAMPPILTGRVVDASGEPIRGVRVVLRAEDAQAAGAWGVTEPVTGVPLAARLDAGDPGAGVTDTGADGRFAFADAPRGVALSLSLRSSAHVPFDVPYFALGHTARDFGDLVLASGVTLRGTVRDEHDAPIAGADVALRWDDDVRARERRACWLPAATTGADGTFVVGAWRVGPFELRVDADGYVGAAAVGTCLEGECAPVEVVLRRGGAIAGRVVLPAGDGERPRLVVQATAVVEGRPRGESATVSVDDEGHFVLEGLEHDGEWLVRARLAEPRSFGGAEAEASLHPTATARAGDRDVVVDLSRPLVVVLRPIDEASGEPLGAVDVAVMMLANDVSHAATTTPTPGGEWRALVWWHPGAGTARAVVVADGFHRLTLDAPSATPNGVCDLGEVRLRRSETVDVVVLDATSGAPIAGAIVETAKSGFPDFPRHRPFHVAPFRDGATTNDDGFARLASTRPGRAVVRVEAVGHGVFERVLEPDETRVEARLAPPTALHVRVMAAGTPQEGVTVRVVRAGYSPFADTVLAATGADGRAVVEALVGTSCAISVPHPAAPWSSRVRERVEFLHDGQEVVLELPPPTTLVGRVTRHGVPVVGALVRGRAERVEVGPGAWDFRTGAGSAVSDVAGRFELTDPAPGELELVIAGGGLPSDVDATVALVSGANHVELDVSDAQVFGIAVDDTGAPLAGLTIALLAAGDDGLVGDRPRRACEAVIDERGRFRFEAAPPGSALSLSLPDTHVPPATAVTPAPGSTVDLGVLVCPRTAVLEVTLDAYGSESIIVLNLTCGEALRSASLIRGQAKRLTLPAGRWTLRGSTFMRNEALLLDEVQLAPAKTRSLVVRFP